MSILPVVAQIKSVCQLLAGNKEAALETQVKSFRSCPGLSLGTSLYYLVSGDTSEALAVQRETGKVVLGVPEGIPVVGHALSGVYYLAGHKDGAKRAIRASNRTTAAMAGGLAGLTLGPAGAVFGGMTGATIADGIVSLEDSSDGKLVAVGNILLFQEAMSSDADDKTGTAVELALSLAGDGLSGMLGCDVAKARLPSSSGLTTPSSTTLAAATAEESALGGNVAQPPLAPSTTNPASSTASTANAASSTTTNLAGKTAKAAKARSRIGKFLYKKARKYKSNHVRNVLDSGTKLAEAVIEVAPPGSEISNTAIDASSALKQASDLMKPTQPPVPRSLAVPSPPQPPPSPPPPPPTFPRIYRAPQALPDEPWSLPRRNNVFPEPGRLFDVRQCQQTCDNQPVVVMIHGLDGHPIDTWVPARAKHDRAAVWSMLQQDAVIPGGTRILSAGHQLSVMTECNLTEETDMLLDLLETAGVVNARSILWIVHSMGGLVVKDLLLRFPALRHRTRGVVFYATPHAGANLASLRRNVQVRLRGDLVPLAASGALTVMDQQCEVSSAHLNELSRAFVTFDIPHITLCETRPISLTMLGLVGVDTQIVLLESSMSLYHMLSQHQRSAVLGGADATVPRHHVEIVERNHADIKLHAGDRGDPVYQHVRRHVKAMLTHTPDAV